MLITLDFKVKDRQWRMAQCLRVHTDIIEDPSFITRIYPIDQKYITPSPGKSDTLTWTHTHALEIKINL